MATPKKKHLIELMIAANVKWPDGAEYAAQDRHNLKVNFYHNEKPNYQSEHGQWIADNCTFMSDKGFILPSLCRNWHQTIVTRKQYEKALADTSVTPTAQPVTEYCASVLRQMPNNTIEQLAAEYHTKAAEAQRLQGIADEALKAADNALLELKKAGELIGLLISTDTQQKQVEQLEITDWRDLRIGDVIECIGNWDGEKTDGNTYQVTNLDPRDSSSPIPIQIYVPGIERPETWGSEFKFISRP